MIAPGALARSLADSGERLAAVDAAVLQSVWLRTVERWRDASSPLRRELDDELAVEARLSAGGFAAGLDAVLGSVDGDAARQLFDEAAGRPIGDAGPVLVITASNIPALFVQTLLPALALRRPTLVKSPSSAPRLAEYFVRTLREEAREQDAGAVAESVAAAVWRGGDEAVEGAVFESVSTVVAYGEAATLADLERRAGGQVVGYGPMASIAVVSPAADLDSTAAGVARDVALFDQRGCLSVHAVFVDHRWAHRKAFPERLSDALRERADAWPPFRPDASEPVAAAVRLAREAAELTGGWHGAADLLAGTVLLEPEPTFQPSPGGRLVRVFPIDEISTLPNHLGPWADGIQGVAIEPAPFQGRDGLLADLRGLGVSRIAAPGQLQTPDALWHNGGRHPLEALSS